MVIPTVEKDIVLIGGMTFHLCHMAKAMSESWRSTVMDGGISKRLCGPLVAVGAMCCVRAFRDGLLARIAETRETSPWLPLYQAASLDCCVAALMVLGRVLSNSPESKFRFKVMCGKVFGAFGSKEPC